MQKKFVLILKYFKVFGVISIYGTLAYAGYKLSKKYETTLDISKTLKTSYFNGLFQFN